MTRGCSSSRIHPQPTPGGLSVVMLGPILARTVGRSAGENYVGFVHKSLAAKANVTVIAPDSPVNRRALEEGVASTRNLRAGTAQSGGRGTKLAFALAHRCYYSMVKVDTGAVPLPFAVSLVLDPDIRRAVRGADVIDLQWAEYVRLAWLVRLLNPSARLVGTFHDVLSQRFARYATVREPGETLFAWRVSTWIARRAERAAGRRCDVVVALSEKDRDQLSVDGSSAVFAVVDPPVRRSAEPEANSRPEGDPVVLFVAAMDRDDNIDAVEWFVAEVWPGVILEFPTARLRLVGSGAGPRVREAARAGTRVTVTGFVEDLAPEYFAASVAVVPLRVGAGVKFKTIEAMLAGVPVVTTSIGAEGIAEASRFWGLVD
ncbi:MAG: glycosyltransferase, partial [Rhodococcus sp. (in: high G+C Gram-positive bacteria)]